MWRDGEGKPKRLVSKAYMDALSKPSFPEFNTGYGFLTWLNARVNKTGSNKAHCCAPRWSYSHLRINQTVGNTTLHGTCCTAKNGSAPPPCNLSMSSALSEWSEDRHEIMYEASEYIQSSIIDDNTPAGLPKAPYDLMMGQGLAGKYMFMVPSMNLTVVTMGNSQPTSSTCANGYDDSFLVALAWNAMAAAFVPGGGTVASSVVSGGNGSQGTGISSSSSSSQYGGGERQGDARNSSSGGVTTRSRVDTPNSDGAKSTTRAAAAPTAPHPEDSGSDAIVFVTEHKGVSVGEHTAGSCTCDCPSNLGFGRCFSVAASALPPNPELGGRASSGTKESLCYRLHQNSTASRKIHSPQDYCPAEGFTVSCDPAKDTNTSQICSNLGHPGHGRSAGGCTPLRQCASFKGMAASFAVATCSCPVPYPTMRPCTWSPQPCVYSSYYLPG